MIHFLGIFDNLYEFSITWRNTEIKTLTDKFEMRFYDMKIFQF